MSKLTASVAREIVSNSRMELIRELLQKAEGKIVLACNELKYSTSVVLDGPDSEVETVISLLRDRNFKVILLGYGNLVEISWDN